MPRPSIRRAPAGAAGAGPAPTAVMRPPSHTTSPSANSRRSASTVAMAQPAMTVTLASRAGESIAWGDRPDRDGHRRPPGPRRLYGAVRRRLRAVAVGGGARVGVPAVRLARRAVPGD